MKKFVLLFVLALSCLAPVAQAQGVTNLGAVVTFDSDRIAQGVGTSFSLDAFSAGSLRGLDWRNDRWIGSNDSSTGMQAVVPRTTILLPRLTVDGIKKLVGVKFATEANLPPEPNDKRWVDTAPDPRGGFSYAIDTGRDPKYWGYVSFSFMILHRDGRDRLGILIITITWIRGGNITPRYQVMIQNAPDILSTLRGEEWFPYVRGFMPATARAEGQQQPTQTQRIDVPAQTVTKTVTNPEPTKAKNGNEQFSTEPEVKDLCSVVMGAYHNDGDQLISPDRKNWTDYESRLVDKARGLPIPQTASEAQLSNRRKQVLFVLNDTKPFKAEVLVGDKTFPLRVDKTSRGYEAIGWGETQMFVERTALLTVTDSEGRLRTVTFVWDK